MKRHTILFFAASLAFACTAVSASDNPPRKPGLWETRTQIGGHPTVTQVCILSAADDAQINAESQATMKAMCSKLEMHQQGGKWISDSVCMSGHMTTHNVITANGDSAYHSEGTTNGAPITSDAKWMGPCKPGQKSGPVSGR
jgi:hypothetical protein